jgi:hypothetical protein
MIFKNIIKKNLFYYEFKPFYSETTQLKLKPNHINQVIIFKLIIILKNYL